MATRDELPGFPPGAFRVFTLDENNTPRSHMGGAGSELAAVTLAAALVQTARVPVVVLDDTDAIVAYLTMPLAI